MKTETEGKQYLEPVGFTGTKGKWDVAGSMVHFPFEIGMWGDDLFTPNLPFKMAKVFGNTEEQAIENAKLISKSKELAKALQDIVKEFTPADCLRIEEQQALETAKQVLKDAGLSDK